MRSWMVCGLACCLVAGCVDSGEDDGEGDEFSTDGKADGASYSAAEIAGALAYVNQATAASLRDDAGVSSTAASNITKHRAGADKKLGTADDDPFDTLKELDDVPYVGPKTFQHLVEYAKAHGFIAASFCPTEHADTAKNGAPIAVCDALYDAAPFVHTPADVVDGNTVTIAGGVMPDYGLVLHAADGRQFYLVNAAGEHIYQSNPPAGFSMPENMFTVYAVTGTMTTVDSAYALKVTKLVPIAKIPGAVQDAHLLGTWEAKASKHIGAGKFDPTQQIPFRFTLSKTKVSTIWGTSGGDGLVVSGSIDNFDKRVKAADGTCLASLSSLGSSSPFTNATANTIGLWRHPSMHGINDQVIVMDYPTASVDLSQNGMSGVGPFSPAGLIQMAGPDYSDVTIYPHATPTGHQVFAFKKVDSGGENCP